jgi:hypothetical protein
MQCQYEKMCVFFLVFFHLPSVGSCLPTQGRFFKYYFLSQSDEGLFFSHKYKIENEPSESFFFPLAPNEKICTQLFTVYVVCAIV